MADPDKPSFAMPLEEPAEPAHPRDSATILVVRDGARGIETFMLLRALNSDFVGGAYVFPGGTVDEADRDPELKALVDGLSPDLEATLGDDALGFVVCAIRETFEEAGILLARHPDGSPVRLTEGETWAEHRRALNAREITAAELARRAKIRFAADLLRFWIRWVTPVQAPKRYDTRFFLALMPEGQEPLHDDYETTASEWVHAGGAVERALAGEFAIIFPTRKTLESIAGYTDARELFAAAVGRPADAILPRILMREGEPRLMLPGDPTYHRP